MNWHSHPERSRGISRRPSSWSLPAGKAGKAIGSILFFLTTFCLLPTTLHAQAEFITKAAVTYEVLGDDTTHITHDISIENVFTTIFTPTYTLKLTGVNPINVKAHMGGQELPVSVQKSSNTAATITIAFPDPALGRGKSSAFTVEFTDKNLVTKTGDVIEVMIPKIPTGSNFDTYDAKLIVPVSIGSESFISPEPISRQVEGSKASYSFTKDQLTQAGVVAAFGEFQVFSLNLSYHLENPLQRPQDIEVAIPPDTAFQRMIYESIAPAPNNVRVDEDGNWIAVFSLKPREKVDVVLKAHAQIFSKPRPFIVPTTKTLDDNTKAQEYWEVDDRYVSQIAGTLETPQDIYDYIVQKFTYNYARVQPNVKRLGAASALRSPGNAICMEFTDAFIALARASGIPAREANGYAYTTNSTLQPLSLVADILHSWPEYWDDTLQTWVPIDPTWGNTTGGIDYFNKLDLNHIVFAYHGASSTTPYPAGSYKLGANPEKDVFVGLSTLPGKSTPTINLALKENPRVSFKNLAFTATVKNNGPTALYQQTLALSADDEPVSQTSYVVIPPFAVEEVVFKTDSGLFARNAPDTIKATIAGEEVMLKTNKETAAIVQFTIMLLFIFLLAAGTFLSVYKRKK